MSQPGRPLRIAVPDAVDPAVFRSFYAGAPVVRLAGETMGTTWGVHVAVPRSAGLGAPQLQAMVQVKLDGIVAGMSHWEPGSQLSRFNRADGGTRLELSQDFAAAMAAFYTPTRTETVIVIAAPAMLMVAPSGMEIE